jgi:pilus assembly protein CpaB
MNRKFLFSLLGAVLCGLIAIWIAQRIIIKGKEQDPNNFTKVLVAASTITPGTTITDKMVKLVEVRKNSFPIGATSDLSQVINKQVRSEIVANDYVIPQRLAGTNESAVLGPLTEGNRAMAIRVDEASSIGGFANPGNYVDVVAVLSPGGGSKQVSKVIAQNLKILANNQDTQEITGAARKLGGTVTLAVTPAQAAVLTLAMREGNLHLIGRNQTDHELYTPPEVVINDNLNQTPREPSTPKLPPVQPVNYQIPTPAAAPKILPSPSVAPTKMAQVVRIWKGSVPQDVQVTK